MNSLKPQIEKQYEELTKRFGAIREQIDDYGKTDLDGILWVLSYQIVMDEMKASRAVSSLPPCCASSSANNNGWGAAEQVSVTAEETGIADLSKIPEVGTSLGPVRHF